MKRLLTLIFLCGCVICADAARIKVPYAHRRHEAVDLGLSVQWATTNVGAGKPQDYGCYFAWGESKPKDFFSDYDNAFNTLYQRYLSHGLIGPDSIMRLQAADDAAAANWGGEWRMPTVEEMDELLACNWEWTTVDGVYGARVTNPIPGYEDRSIFIPAAGCLDGNEPVSESERIMFWTNSSRDKKVKICNQTSPEATSALFLRSCYGMTVRPVMPIKKNPVESIGIDAVTDTLYVGSKRKLKISTDPLRSVSVNKFVWTSSDNNVARVSQDGEVMAVGTGSCRITAEYGSLKTDCEITVDYRDPASVDLGLSVLWSTVNVGAASPYEIGSMHKADDLQWLEWYEKRGWRIPTYKEVEEMGRLEQAYYGEEDDVWYAVAYGNTPGYENDSIIVASNDDLDRHYSPFMITPDELTTDYIKVEMENTAFPIRLVRDLVPEQTGRPYIANILSRDSVKIEPGEKIVLKVHAQPGNVRDRSALGWRSSDSTVAQVKDGVITAVSPGCCTITAIYGDASCDYHVQVVNAGKRESDYRYVDLGLSVDWAVCNVGSVTEDERGDLFVWGNPSALLDSESTVKGVEPDSIDVASEQWGGCWQLPSMAQMQELIDSCQWQTDTVNGMKGWRVTSRIPGYEDRSIFLPYRSSRSTQDHYMSGELMRTKYDTRFRSLRISDNPTQSTVITADGQKMKLTEYYRVEYSYFTSKVLVRAVRPK